MEIIEILKKHGVNESDFESIEKEIEKLIEDRIEAMQIATRDDR